MIVQEYQRPPVSFYTGDTNVASLPTSTLSYGPVRYVDSIAFPTIPRPGFLQRNRNWIIAGAATIAGGLAYGILQQGESTPSIPGPPGQPAMN
jgi:hypothetical protein